MKTTILSNASQGSKWTKEIQALWGDHETKETYTQQQTEEIISFATNAVSLCSGWLRQELADETPLLIKQLGDALGARITALENKVSGKLSKSEEAKSYAEVLSAHDDNRTSTEKIEKEISKASKNGCFTIIQT